MENSFLKNDYRKFMISHTAQNLINLDVSESEDLDLQKKEQDKLIKEVDNWSNINSKSRSRKSTIYKP